MKNQLIYPMAFYVVYMWGIGVLLFVSRVKAIKSGQISMKYFRAFSGAPPDERTILIGRHYDNQFQVPLLFLICGALHFSMGNAHLSTLIIAWTFILLRVVHSWIHLGANRVQKRAFFFILSWFANLILWLQLLYFAL